MNRKPAYKKPDSIKELEQLAMDQARERHPGMPHLAPRLYRDDTANSLTKAIIDFLRLSGHQAERINNTGRYLDGSKVVTDVLDRQMKIGSGKWIPGSGQKGTADVSAVIRGWSVKIEVKMRDRQSPDQKAYQEAIKQAGGIYLIVNNFEVFMDAYNQINNIEASSLGTYTQGLFLNRGR